MYECGVLSSEDVAQTEAELGGIVSAGYALGEPWITIITVIAPIAMRAKERCCREGWSVLLMGRLAVATEAARG